MKNYHGLLLLFLLGCITVTVISCNEDKQPVVNHTPNSSLEQVPIEVESNVDTTTINIDTEYYESYATHLVVEDVPDGWDQSYQPFLDVALILDPSDKTGLISFGNFVINYSETREFSYQINDEGIQLFDQQGKQSIFAIDRLDKQGTGSPINPDIDIVGFLGLKLRLLWTSSPSDEWEKIALVQGWPHSVELEYQPPVCEDIL